MNPSSPTIGEDLGWVSTNGARGGGGGGEEALPAGGGGGLDGESDEGLVGSGPKWISEGRPSKSSANACKIFFWRTVRDLRISYKKAVMMNGTYRGIWIFHPTTKSPRSPPLWP